MNNISLFEKPLLKRTTVQSEIDSAMQQISNLPPEPDKRNSSNIETELVLQEPPSKQESKKEKWNAYMRQYNAKKKQELEDRLNKVALTINNCEKLYDVKEINQILINNIVILIEICNNNI